MPDGAANAPDGTKYDAASTCVAAVGDGDGDGEAVALGVGVGVCVGLGAAAGAAHAQAINTPRTRPVARTAAP